MKINNNINHNKQVNFKADFKCLKGNRELKNVYQKLLEIALEAPKTEGGLFLMSSKLELEQSNNQLYNSVRFDYFKKNSILADSAAVVHFEMKDDKFISQAKEELNHEEYENRLIEVFKRFAGSDSVIK